MGAALILTAVPILLFSAISLREAALSGQFGVIFAVATVLAVALVGWVRFLMIEKIVEDREAGPEENDRPHRLDIDLPRAAPAPPPPPPRAEPRIAA